MAYASDAGRSITVAVLIERSRPQGRTAREQWHTRKLKGDEALKPFVKSISLFRQIDGIHLPLPDHHGGQR